MGTKLRIHLTENLGFIPPVLGHLATIDNFTDGYRRYRLRHPGGIFNLQLADFTSNLFDLVKAVTAQQNTQGATNSKELVRRLSGTLFTFANYYNAAYDIILGCCKPESNLPAAETWKWLKEHHYTAENVYRSSLSEANFFLDIFNELKHSSKQFGMVSLTRLRDNVQISGYYLECVGESGAISPDPNYHGSTHETHGANSFNSDVRRLYYLLYKIADVLLATLQHHFRETYSVVLPFDSTRQQDGAILQNLFQAITDLPLAFLPNEVRKRVPVARVSGRRDYKYLVFESHKEAGTRDELGAYEVSAVLPAPDGFSKQWSLPYFRNRRRLEQ